MAKTKRQIGCVFLGVVCLLATLVGCGNGTTGNITDDRTLEHFIQAFEASTFNTADRDTPVYAMIGAVNGFMFHGFVDGFPVSVYEFESVAALEQAFINFPIMEQSGWAANGRFVVETTSEDVRVFFTAID